MIDVTLYTRSECSICDQAKLDLEGLQSEIPHKLVEIDIDSVDGLSETYGDLVPVIEVGPYRKEAPFTRQELRVTLLAAQDRVQQLKKLDTPAYEDRQARVSKMTRADRFTLWFTKSYIWVFSLLVLIYLGLPFLAPVFMNAGVPGPARVIYRVYSAVCHQFAFRSFFIYGDQLVYPRSAAGVDGLQTYGEATGLDETDIFTAREFAGNEQVGYKVAFCQRDVAIYGGILLFGLIFGLAARRLPGLPWYLWILIGIVPVALDGFSQLISQPPFNLIPYRESPPLVRTLTGFVFGFATAWFGYPQVEIAMRDTRKSLAVKLSRVQIQQERGAPEA